jgi:hypothetical protein
VWIRNLLTFLKEWVPTLAVIVGGAWLLFQWIFGETLRRRKEIPALEGKLATRMHPYDARRLIVSLEATWRNRSPFPLSLDIKRCWIDVFRISDHVQGQNCVLMPSQDLGQAVCTHHFLVGQCEVDYVLEPNTESLIVNHFVLEPGLYAIRMELHSFTKGGKWWKEVILDAQTPPATNPRAAGEAND